MSWPKPPPSADLCVLADGDKYLRGIDPSGRPLYTRDRTAAWEVSRTYAYRIKNIYQLRAYRVVALDP